MHPAVLAAKEAAAMERITNAARRLVQAHGLDREGDLFAGTHHRDRDYQQLQQTERIAELLEQAADAAEAGKPAPKTAAKAEKATR